VAAVPAGAAVTFAELAERLTRRAAAHARRRGRGWWHRADLLWPLFAKGER